MPETYSTPVQIHRVNTRRRSLQALQCPLEPELLVAEFAGELPPDVANAVREHIAICSTCGERSRTLRAPYELLASLGSEPVSHVPDLRDAVSRRIRAHRFYRGALHAATTVGRGGALGIVSVVGLVAIVAVIVGSVWFTAGARSVARSTNTLAHVPAAAAAGTLFAESDKLVTVTDGHGASWQVTEVLAVDERTGAVVHSLPASSKSLRQASSGQLPVGVAVSPDGSTVYEVTAVNSHNQQAFVAFDATTGTVRYVTTLTYPGGGALLKGNEADALVLAPNGQQAYVGLRASQPWTRQVRVLVFDTGTGAPARQIQTSFNSPIPMPPPPGSLPISAFPSIAPKLDATHLKAGAIAANGELALSADGKWLFDAWQITDRSGNTYGLVQRLNAGTGALAQQLAIPGNFTFSEMVTGAAGQLGQAAQGASATQSQLYLVKGSPDAEVYVLDSGATGPTLAGTIALGGPISRPTDVFSGTLSASPSADGSRLYITQNATTQDGLTTGHDLWLVDTQSMNIIAHRLDNNSADAVQAGTGANGRAFILRGGQVLLIAPDLGGNVSNWLTLNSGHVIRLLGASA